MRIAVLIDLAWSVRSGGHVLCWQRIAEAAASCPNLGVDLELHVQGDRARTVELAPHVRFRMHRPVLSTAKLSFLDHAPDHADLAPIHPALFAALRHVDVVHTTDAYFAYARTARARSRISGTPIVSSLHTDVPSYTRLYSAEVLRRSLGRRLGARTVDAWRIPDRLAAHMRRVLARHVARSAWVLHGERGAPPELAGVGEKASVLRRGVDRALFTPMKRDRARLRHTWSIPEERLVLMFAGRLDRGKRVLLVADAARELLERGHDVQAVFAGDGKDSELILDRLGQRATLTGPVSQLELASLYASSDVFVFPSEIEVAPNVVLEAKASGLPVLVAPAGGGTFVTEPGADGVVIDANDPAPWIEALDALLRAPDQRRALGARARRDIELRHPSWSDVLEKDLLPVWRSVARHPCASSS